MVLPLSILPSLGTRAPDRDATFSAMVGNFRGGRSGQSFHGISDRLFRMRVISLPPCRLITQGNGTRWEEVRRTELGVRAQGRRVRGKRHGRFG